jgi:hypothetical protein
LLQLQLSSCEPLAASQHACRVQVWEALLVISKADPVKDKYKGSHLTMLSKGGFIFGVINIVGNFGTVFIDQSYWQSAIAAKPSATYKGCAPDLCNVKQHAHDSIAARCLQCATPSDAQAENIIPVATTSLVVYFVSGWCTGTFSAGCAGLRSRSRSRRRWASRAARSICRSTPARPAPVRQL